MNDPSLPNVDLVYLGGYPEMYAELLQRYHTMRQSIQAFAQEMESSMRNMAD